jgi:hypothetical protein
MHGLMGGGWKRGATTVDAKDPGGETLGVSAKTYRRATPPRQSSTLHGRFYRTALLPLIRRINAYILKWARKKYKRLASFTRAKAWWTAVTKRAPGLFAHWRWTFGF